MKSTNKILIFLCIIILILIIHFFIVHLLENSDVKVTKDKPVNNNIEKEDIIPIVDVKNKEDNNENRSENLLNWLKNEGDGLYSEFNNKKDYSNIENLQTEDNKKNVVSWGKDVNYALVDF